MNLRKARIALFIVTIVALISHVFQIVLGITHDIIFLVFIGSFGMFFFGYHLNKMWKWQKMNNGF